VVFGLICRVGGLMHEMGYGRPGLGGGVLSRILELADTQIGPVQVSHYTADRCKTSTLEWNFAFA
jgi:hypothetical protein